MSFLRTSVRSRLLFATFCVGILLFAVQVPAPALALGGSDEDPTPIDELLARLCPIMVMGGPDQCAEEPVPTVVDALNEVYRTLEDALPRNGTTAEGEVRVQYSAQTAPVPGARVTLHACAATCSDPVVAETVSGADGRFSFGGIEPGRYQACATFVTLGPECTAAADIAPDEVVDLGAIAFVVATPFPDPLPPPAGDALAEGRVFLAVADGSTVPAFGAFVQMQRLVPAGGGFEFQNETNASGLATPEIFSVTEFQATYRIPVVGMGGIYRACAMYPALAEPAVCSAPSDIDTYRQMEDIILQANGGTVGQDEVMELVPAALNCGAHETVSGWVSQLAFDADCNGWNNVEELAAGCNPFNPAETPLEPASCTGPAANGLDPSDPNTVLRFVSRLVPPGANCSKQENPASIAGQLALDADCDGWTNHEEINAGCSPVNPTSYPGSPFPGACHPLPSNPNVQSLRDWVEAAPEWAQGQQPWLLITALSLMHPWVLWAVLVVLGSAPDVPPLP